MNIPSNIETMSAVELIHALAFRRADYIPEAQAALEQQLQSAGYSPTHVRTWRELFLNAQSAKAICQNCQGEVLLEHEILRE